MQLDVMNGIVAQPPDAVAVLFFFVAPLNLDISY